MIRDKICNTCRGTGLIWTGDPSWGTEKQVTCHYCNGKKTWDGSVLTKTELNRLSDWEISSIIWNTIYSDIRRFKDLEKDTQLEWEKIITMALDYDNLNQNNPDLLRKLKFKELDIP